MRRAYVDDDCVHAPLALARSPNPSPGSLAGVCMCMYLGPDMLPAPCVLCRQALYWQAKVGHAGARLPATWLRKLGSQDEAPCACALAKARAVTMPKHSLLTHTALVDQSAPAPTAPSVPAVPR